MGQYAESFNGFEGRQHGTIGHLMSLLKERDNDIEKLKDHCNKCCELIEGLRDEYLFLKNYADRATELILLMCETNITDKEKIVIYQAIDTYIKRTGENNG
ncbi:MAG: hypothetical protein EOL93_01935 [Epsilonproteobacteria bacterium]|nr:hypothetical protein [Campylobacterota bacterium]